MALSQRSSGRWEGFVFEGVVHGIFSHLLQRACVRTQPPERRWVGTLCCLTNAWGMALASGWVASAQVTLALV